MAYGLKDRILEVSDLRIAEDSRNTRFQFGAFKYGTPYFPRTSATEKKHFLHYYFLKSLRVGDCYPQTGEA